MSERPADGTGQRPVSGISEQPADGVDQQPAGGLDQQPAGGADQQQPSSELRLAVAFTGGLSLAVWMGGMAREINLLLAASRIRRGEEVADTSAQGRKVRAGYQALLDLLNVDCSVDILSGSGAGSINAAVLGLANVQRFDLDGLRELWFELGSLGTLLRDPADKQAASLLYGDKSLLAGLRAGLARLAEAVPGNPAAADDPTTVFITTTLLTGEASRFIDQYGTLVSDTDHHGLFSFTSAQLTAGNVPALALAARCSASLPAAFEPGFIPIGADGGAGHPDMAPFASTQSTQFAADGGLLADRPLGPVLQAVFDRAADRDVRRVLAFVVPTADGGAPSKAKLTLADTPGLAPALAADLSAILSQTISADLAAITAHNQQVRARNDARQQLAILGAQMDRLGAPFYRTYRVRRAGTVAQTAAAELMTRMTLGSRAADGRPPGYGADSEHVRAAANKAAEGVLPAGLPEAGDYAGMNAAGREALDDGRATVLAVLSRSYHLVRSAQKKRALGNLRKEAAEAMPDRPELRDADTFARALAPWPQVAAAGPAAAGPGAAGPGRSGPGRSGAAGPGRSGAGGPGAAGSVAAVAAAVAVGADGRNAVQAAAAAAAAAHALLNANMATGPSDQPWLDLATVVLKLRSLLPVPAGAEPETERIGPGQASAFVHALLLYLTGPDGGYAADTVAARLFDLHVARYVMQPDGVLADQALELVQMSSDTRTDLDRRTLAGEKLTGLQLHHFGAFYKASWRANDWMWGRLDGAGWLVHVLLDPRRLSELAGAAPGRARFREDLRAGLQQIAGCPAPQGVWDPFPPDAGQRGAAAEMAFLSSAGAPPPTSLPVTAMWVASGLQKLIAGEELAQVARQIKEDGTAGADESRAQAFVSAYRNAVGEAGSYPAVPDAKVVEVLHACQVPAEKIESEVGSPLLTRTVTRAAAVAVKTVDPGNAVPSFLRPVLAGARTVTSLAYRVSSVGPAARYPLFAGLALLALGVLASTSTVSLISAAGLAAVLAGLLLIAVGAARRIVLALAVVAIAAGAALGGADYIPALRDHLFPWLEKTAFPSLEKHPAEWAILVVFVLLPPLWAVASIIRRLTRSRWPG